MGQNNSSEAASSNLRDQKAEEREAYRYSLLSTPTSIRLLEILPEGDSIRDEVHCTMVEADLDEEPIFDALSYTWGPSRTVYRWNEALPAEDAYHRTKEVICDGRSLMVTENCLSALKHLRGMKEVRSQQLDEFLDNRQNTRIWVDAICINQSEDQQALAEKSSQVQIMHRIYRQAQTVFIWLGPEDDSSRDAITTLRLIAAQPLERALEIRHYSILAPDPYEELGMPYLDTNKWFAIYTFLHRAYFPRAWIVQEVAFARKPIVLCGTLIFPWEMVSQASGFICRARWHHQMAGVASLYLNDESDSEIEEESRYLLYPALDGYQALSKNPFMARVFQGMESVISHYAPRNILGGTFKQSPQMDYEPAVHILELSDLRLKHTLSAETGSCHIIEPLPVILMKCRSAQTSEPQDNIYAFLGLASESSWRGLSIDYRRPVWESFLGAAWAMIRSSGSVRLFSLVEDRSVRKVDGLPSWVPDFTAERRPDPLDAGDPCPYRAGGETVWREDIARHTPKHIIVQGVHYDTVEKVKQFQCYDLNSIDELADCLSNMPFDRIWRTLVGDRFLGLYPAPNHCDSLFSNLLRKHLEEKTMLMLLRVRGLPTRANKFREADTDFRSAFTSWRNLQGPDAVDDGLMESHSILKHGLWAIYLAANQGLIYLSPGEDPYRIYDVMSDALEKCLQENSYDSETAELNARIRITHQYRSLFQSRGMRLGHGPKSTQPGDEVWVLTGSRVPYVLRPVEKNTYELIGEAYMHGIMQGEAMSENQLPLKSICLQ